MFRSDSSGPAHQVLHRPEVVNCRAERAGAVITDATHDGSTGIHFSVQEPAFSMVYARQMKPVVASSVPSLLLAALTANPS